MVTPWTDFHWTSESPDLRGFNWQGRSPCFCLLHLWSNYGQEPLVTATYLWWLWAEVTEGATVPGQQQENW